MALASGCQLGMVWRMYSIASLVNRRFPPEQDPALRAFLVKGAWERRDPMAIHLLTEALDQRDEEIWQAALDGLVTFLA
jgi:hypothetical protein